MGRAAPKVSADQTSFLSLLEPAVPLDPAVVLLGDPRWEETVDELARAPYHSLDLEFFDERDEVAPPGFPAAPKVPGKAGGKKRRVDPWRTTIRLIQVGLPSGRVLVADLGGIRDDRAERAAKHARFLDVLGRVMYDRQKLTIGHHLKGDALLLRVWFGFKVRAARCTMLLSQIYWAGVRGYRHGLAAACKRLGRHVDKRLQSSDWRGYLSNTQINYAARDTLDAVFLYRELGRRVRDEGLLNSANAEMAALPAFVECEYHGMPVDPVMLDTHIAIWERARAEVIRPFLERYPGVDPGKGEKVAVALSKDRCYDGHKFYSEGAPTKTGKRRISPKVGEEVLVKWDALPWIVALMEWRSIGTQEQYLKGVREKLRAWRVRGEYAQIAGGEDRGGGDKEGRGMGRSSCSKPNLQNSGNLQPAHRALGCRHTRESFRPMNAEMAARLRARVAELDRDENLPPGVITTIDRAQYRRALLDLAEQCERRPRAMIVADLSQAHARIATQASRDATLLAAYNAGADVHCITASALVQKRGRPWSASDVNAKRKDKHDPDHPEAKQARDTAKPVFYGSLNLQGPATLQRTAETAPEPVKMTIDEAAEARDAWRTAYAGLYSYQRRVIREANARDVVIDGHHYAVNYALTGRRLHLLKEPDKYSKTEPLPCKDCGKDHGRLTCKGTDCVASVWMMTEADAIKRAMGLILDAFDAHPEWEAVFCNMAHDEVDVECAEAYAVDVATCVQQIFHDCMRWAGVVDLPVDEANADPKKMIVTCWADK